jgi:hypothetical protein
VRTINAIERLHEEFKRRTKMQTVLPSADNAAMLFWALLASGQITLPHGLTGISMACTVKTLFLWAEHRYSWSCQAHATLPTIREANIYVFAAHGGCHVLREFVLTAGASLDCYFIAWPFLVCLYCKRSPCWRIGPSNSGSSAAARNDRILSRARKKGSDLADFVLEVVRSSRGTGFHFWLSFFVVPGDWTKRLTERRLRNAIGRDGYILRSVQHRKSRHSQPHRRSRS